MRAHLLDLNDGHPNRGVEALRAALGPAAEVRVWAVRDRGEVPPADEGVWVLSGGPGSPTEEGPWRAPVLEALRERVRQDRPTLAVCYGFELLGAAMGAELRLLSTRRLGVWPVRLTATGVTDPVTAGLHGAGSFENRRWGVFGGGGAVLALGEEGDVVAARYAPRVVGAIFHPEAAPAAVAEVLDGPVGDEVDACYGPGARPAMRALGVGRVFERVLPAFLASLGDR